MRGIYKEFLKAVDIIIRDLNLRNIQREIRKYETPKVGVDYISHIIAKDVRILFSLRTHSDTSDLNKWNCLVLSIYFYNRYDLCQLARHKQFKKDDKVDIIQWVEEVVNEYRRKKNSNDLRFIFGDRDITVHGIAGATNRTLLEFIITLKGYLNWGAKRLLLYRFHHKEKRCEGFSYAFLIECRELFYDYSFWCVFPDFVGTCGGTSYSGYRTVESLLKKVGRRINVEIIDIEVPRETFIEFLEREHVRFSYLSRQERQLTTSFERMEILRQLIAEVFENAGYYPISPKVGLDLLVKKDSQRIGIIYKLYKDSLVPTTVVHQALRCLDSYKLDACYIISLRGFTDNAKKVAQNSQNKIKLFTFKELLNFLNYPLSKSKFDGMDILKRSKIRQEINFKEFSEIWCAVKKARTKKQKKESLETLAAFLFNSIKGLQVKHKNVRAAAEEIDLIVANESSLPFWHNLGNPFFVECKNWSKKVEPKDLRDFKGKLESHGIKTGFLISLMGFTKGCKKIVRETKQKGLCIICLVGEDLEEIAKGVNPTDKIKEKFYENYRY